MSTEVWGNLPKALDDATTIDQAIAAAIAAHEADSEAHLGAGESLETHRSYDILDHPQGSVVGDKQGSNELVVTTNFDSVDSWSIQGNVTGVFPGVEIHPIFDDGPRSRIVSAGLGKPGDPYLFDREIVFQANLNIEDMIADCLVFFGVTSSGYSPSSAPNTIGIYFRCDGTDLFAGVGNFSGTATEEDLGVDFTDFHTYRAHYVPDDENVYFYVDGVLAATIAIPGSGLNISPAVQFYAGTEGETADFYIRLLSMQLWQAGPTA